MEMEGALVVYAAIGVRGHGGRGGAGRGFLMEGGEGDGSDNNFNASPRGDDQLNFKLVTGGRTACPWVWRACLRGNSRLKTAGWVYRAVFSFSNVLSREI